MAHTLRYTCRLLPHPHQASALKRLMGCCRRAYNDAVAYLRQQRDHRGEDKVWPDKIGDLKKLIITEAKKYPERVFFNEVGRDALDSAIQISLASGLKNWRESITGKRKGRRVGFPRFRKAAGRQTFQLTNSKPTDKNPRGTVRFRIEGNCLWLSGISAKYGTIPIVLDKQERRPLMLSSMDGRQMEPGPGEHILLENPKTVTVTLDRDGTFHASFVVKVDIPPFPMNEPLAIEGREHQLHDVIGIDRGVVNAIALDKPLTGFAAAQYQHLNGQHLLESPRPLKRFLRKKARMQRKMARQRDAAKAQGRTFWTSKRYNRQRRRLAKLHARIANIRKDFNEQVTTQIVRECQTIKIEALNTQAMMGRPKASRTKRGAFKPNGRKAKAGLNRSIADVAWGQIRQMLKAKAAMYGRELIEVRAAYTSQTCPECGHVHKDNRKTQAQFRCLKCGFEANADIVGAINIASSPGLEADACKSPESLNGPDSGQRTAKLADPQGSGRGRVRRKALRPDASPDEASNPRTGHALKGQGQQTLAPPASDPTQTLVAGPDPPPRADTTGKRRRRRQSHPAPGQLDLLGLLFG